MEVRFLKRGFFQRLFGIPATPKSKQQAGWNVSSGMLIIDLNKTPELQNAGNAMRFEGKNLPGRVLVIYGEDKQYRAFENRCTHVGHRRLDPVPGTRTIQCCSVGKSTYGFDGNPIYGPAPKPIKTYPVQVKGNELHVFLFEQLTESRASGSS
ncbi:MAG: (2Fe-2S)-binding protein [Deltaproteobacteria bacterium RBG_13_49_15]|nr:MAG: (2Fe-2S)-binding protein [Deltaproteobacteria bacterium RBG_13_49_15]